MDKYLIGDQLFHVLENKLYRIIWVKVFKNRPSKICGWQPLKNFTWSILEYLDPSTESSVYSEKTNSTGNFWYLHWFQYINITWQHEEWNKISTIKYNHFPTFSDTGLTPTRYFQIINLICRKQIVTPWKGLVKQAKRKNLKFAFKK